MPQDTHIVFDSAFAERMAESSLPGPDAGALQAHARQLARDLVWLPNTRSSGNLFERHEAVGAALRPLFRVLQTPLPDSVSDDRRWLHDNVSLLDTELTNTAEPLKLLRKLPHVRTPSGGVVPRSAALAAGFLSSASYAFTEESFTAYVEAFEENTVLKVAELWALAPILELVLLEEIAIRAPRVLADPQSSQQIGICIQSLREVSQTFWKRLLEPLILFDRVLRQDPAGAYAQMDFESRDLYRQKVVAIAQHSDLTELEVAIEAVALAREAQQRSYMNPRVAARESHVGYYLVAAGSKLLHERTGYKYPLGRRIQKLLRDHPDEFYLAGIEVITFAIVLAILLPLIGHGSSLGLILLSFLVLLLPSSQSAVRLVNYVMTSVLPAQILPKLDFSEGIPESCATLVAIPSLLLNEKQIRRLVEDLEVRFLANHDPHVHFALLTDLPDSNEPAEEDDPRIRLCAQLIRELNEKYADREMGSFLLLHRHRVYNPRERMWMGWERKRGKLLDLNKLLRNQYDSFPIKEGPVSVLPSVSFVITLDSDTELPRGAAQRMIGALAHPLNRAIVDPERNVVVAGYGILQPRVGVSVQSAGRSRLASIYSGETGLDIYTRAVSDVYQDLYGEGIFAGKGIYEVDILHQVLDRRFPRNILLSHDLIEGAYARAGLVSDIEVIEDYPSHYSAYNRRKHRWLRGDWQIAEWLLSHVPDESGHRVPNPISMVSKWKILDNLRRSLVEPATFLLLVLGWLALPRSAAYWTVATIIILFVPSWFRFGFALVQAAAERKEAVARDGWDDLFTANVSVFFTLTFLAHQTLLSLDAVVRTLVRRIFTRQRLLQWETAAEAELGTARRAPVDLYLAWMPLLALALGVLIYAVHRNNLAVSLPILVLWAASPIVALWLNRPPRGSIKNISEKERLFLRRAALRTWRYFAEFSTEEHNWLIPDNVQEEPPAVAARFSPTNLGLLLNARQAACEFGYLTVPELAALTSRTLATMARLERHRGHLLNWYETRTLAPLPPRFVSSVDNGNLVVSLWTLEQGCLECLRRPLLQPALLEGLLDYFRTLVELHALPRRSLAHFRRETRRKPWLQSLLDLPEEVLQKAPRKSANPRQAADARWFGENARALLQQVKTVVGHYTPWLLPEFAPLAVDPALNLNLAVDDLELAKLPQFIDLLSSRLQNASGSASPEQASLYRRLQPLLPQARANCLLLIQDLRTIAAQAQEVAAEMDFQFLLDPRRKLLSVGFDVESGQRQAACYDLLASESRAAAFVAIAKDEIPQETWFRLGRAHALYHGRQVLLSWTGTMFEYLMPGLWMRTYPNTLLDRTRVGAVRSQQAYTARKSIPWGISESAYFKVDEAGNYQYRAFGVPTLALQKSEDDFLVISPYSSLLALTVDPVGALRNLRLMARYGWIGSYGFYEAADYTPAHRKSRMHRYELVRCWMTHHHGMSLLSLANFLHHGVVQRWFHNDPRVQATELLLHEKPMSHVRPARESYETLAS